VRVFALNYATSCGNVWHQVEKDWRTGAAGGKSEGKSETKMKAVLRTVKCGGSNFPLQHRENQKGKYK